jgi:VanZ family protein
MGEQAFAMGRPGHSKLAEWIPIILWAAVIFIFSTSGFSAANTSRVIIPMLKWMFPAASSASLFVASALIRKAAHFTEYAIFFWLLIRGPLEGRPVLAMALCVAYALTDEGHQIFVAGRGASLYDVALDSTGAMFSSFLRNAISELV